MNKYKKKESPISRRNRGVLLWGARSVQIARAGEDMEGEKDCRKSEEDGGGGAEEGRHKAEDGGGDQNGDNEKDHAREQNSKPEEEHGSRKFEEKEGNAHGKAIPPNDLRGGGG